MEKPKQKAIIDYKELEVLVSQYLDDIGTDEMTEDQQSDREHYIFEAAVNAIYGDAAWNYINSKI